MRSSIMKRLRNNNQQHKPLLGEPYDECFICTILCTHHTAFKKAAPCPFYIRKYCLHNQVTFQHYTARLEGPWVLNLDLLASRGYDLHHYSVYLTPHQMCVLNACLTRLPLMWPLSTLQASPIFPPSLFLSHAMPHSFCEQSMIFLTIEPLHKVFSSPPM